MDRLIITTVLNFMLLLPRVSLRNGLFMHYNLNIYGKYVKFITLLLIIIFFHTEIFGAIHEVKSVAEIRIHLENIPTEALCIVDLDETVIVSPHLIGSSRWFGKKIDELKRYTNNHEHALKAVVRQYIYVHENNQMELVEGAHTKAFIDYLHDIHHVLYITARDARLLAATERQLSAHNLLFNASPYFQDREVHLALFGLEDGLHNRAKNGIVYAHGGDKGICLEKYLHAIGCDSSNFSCVVGIDDKESNLHVLESAAKRMNLDFVGFRYGAADHLAHAPVDLELANLQYEMHKKNPHLGFLNDADAKARLQTMH